MSQKNFRNCKTMTSPAELKSGRCAKSCFNHWKWLEMTKVRNHMDLPLPDYWFVPKRTFELFLQRLERLVQPNHRLHQKVRRAEYCENHLPLLRLLVLELHGHHPVVQLGDLPPHHLHLFIHAEAFCALSSSQGKIVFETAAFGDGDTSLLGLDIVIWGLNALVCRRVGHIFKLYRPGVIEDVEQAILQSLF